MTKFFGIRMMFCFAVLFISFQIQGAVWQWSVKLESAFSKENSGHPTAFLWIPKTCTHVNGVIVGMHNMLEEGIMEHDHFREVMEDLGFATIWITPGLDPLFDPSGMSQEAFDEALRRLAKVSGYSEIAHAPIVPIGHSAYATYPWNFGAWNPDRTLAIISIHGDAPRTNLTGCGRPNLDWGTRNTDGIPGLMVMAEYEWWEDRLMPAIQYKNAYPCAPVSLLANAGYSHFDFSDSLIEYLALFIRKAANYRIRPQQSALAPVFPSDGWLAERWRKDQKPKFCEAPFAKYKGDKSDAFWYFDEEMARATADYYANARGKKERYLGFWMNGNLLHFDEKHHARYNLTLKPDNDSLTFVVKGVFTDSSRTHVHRKSSKEKVAVDIICGSAVKLNDTTFAPRFYHLGMDNRKRSNTFWLKAHHNGTRRYKSAVQQAHFSFEYPVMEGRQQKISFDKITDISASTRELPLSAESDCGLPIFYYVKVGPAIVVGNKLLIEELPPKTSYPVKVTVVAWQYGRPWSHDKIRSASPVERSFLITN